jgi:hypothetical protein
MAETAIGATCPHCQTFLAVSGSKGDKQLAGQCPVCKTGVTKDNPEYLKSPFEDAYDALLVKHQETVADLAAARIEITKLKAGSKPNLPPPSKAYGGNG